MYGCGWMWGREVFMETVYCRMYGMYGRKEELPHLFMIFVVDGIGDLAIWYCNVVCFCGVWGELDVWCLVFGARALMCSGVGVVCLDCGLWSMEYEPKMRFCGRFCGMWSASGKWR